MKINKRQIDWVYEELNWPRETKLRGQMRNHNGHGRIYIQCTKVLTCQNQNSIGFILYI